MTNRRQYQDHTHLLPKVREIEERGTVSSQTALVLIGIGCALVVYGILFYDAFYG